MQPPNAKRVHERPAAVAAKSPLAMEARRPISVEDTGLPLTLLTDLLLRHLIAGGVLSLSQIIRRLALAGPIVETVLNALRADGRIEVRARLGIDAELRYGLTDKGRSEAGDAMSRAGYVGPAPVTLIDYCRLVQKQSVHARKIDRDALLGAFAGLVLPSDLIDKLGPAINSSRALLLYGHAGTGKTYTARKMAGAVAGTVLVPYAIAINDTIVEVFDPTCHREIAGSQSPLPQMLQEGFDPRYVACERPVVVTGGELSAEMLEVRVDPRSNRNTAPIQLKANNGLLLIDDLGRQRIEPSVLFNRWIVPMESRKDSLLAGNGQHFEVPFDLVLVLSTNLTPTDIADDAFLRRLGYKIEFRPVSTQEYRQIWYDVCRERGLYPDPELVDFVIHDLHLKRGVSLLPCHPRDLIAMSLDRAAFSGAEAELDREGLHWAWENYFVKSAPIKTNNERGC